MIVPMQRLTLLCSVRERESALEALRALGCVHVRIDVRDGEAIRHATANVTAVEQALRVLDTAERNGTFAFKPDAASPIAAQSVDQLLATAQSATTPTTTADINTLAELVTRLREEAFHAEMALKRYAPFGEIDPETIAALGANGLPVTLFRVPVAEAESVTAFTFGSEGGYTYGAWVSAEPLPDGCETLPPPERSTAHYRTILAETAAQSAHVIDLLTQAAGKLRPQLKSQLRVASSEKTAAEVSANLRDVGEVAYLQGYIPAREGEKLQAKANEEGWGIVLETPAEDDPEVPVLLEPPRGFRAINNIFTGLGILPGYTEGDVSVPFYLFFSLFFAMLVGDAGYGALMLLATLIGGWKFRKVKAAHSVVLIFTVFSLSTILWGVLSGTYFGIAKSALPACLTAIPTVGWLGQDVNIIFLCFLIGAIHISIARIWNAILLLPNLRALGEIGWLGVTWSMFAIVCGIVVSWFNRPDWITYLLGGSVILILIPMVKNIKQEGVNIGMLPLNVISSMGDIISYVRLFAVGLASVKVAENFNMMATSMEMNPILSAIACVAILLLGHGLNLAMGALSILVHAVRLNTLEFSNAKGITWSGTPYRPFKKLIS